MWSKSLLLLLQGLLWPCHSGNNQRFERQVDSSLRFSGEVLGHHNFVFEHFFKAFTYFNCWQMAYCASQVRR
jgi:hypothetical protein